MIQRIQTVYLIVAIILIACPLAGLEILSYTIKGQEVSKNVYSFHLLKQNETEPSYFYLVNIFLCLFGFYVMMSFKNLKRQLMLSRIFIGLIFFAFTMPLILAIGRSDLFPGIGFYSFMNSIIFVVLAIRGINKDKKLIDSLNRLR
jgi:peptidoglycan/LPS O-acetylase OafA/YrhL